VKWIEEKETSFGDQSASVSSRKSRATTTTPLLVLARTVSLE
jgi:hypothetical protein